MMRQCSLVLSKCAREKWSSTMDLCLPIYSRHDRSLRAARAFAERTNQPVGAPPFRAAASYRGVTYREQKHTLRAAPAARMKFAKAFSKSVPKNQLSEKSFLEELYHVGEHKQPHDQHGQFLN